MHHSMEAVSNRKQLDMLHGPIWNKLPRFALPVAATAILEQLFNASDVAVVGNFTGAECTVSVAAVGANSPIIGLIVNLFIGIALGSNVVIAHAIGNGNMEDVQKAVHTSILVSIIGGTLVGLIGEIVAAPLLGLLNVPDDVFPLAPALLTMLGVCGIRIVWINFVFPQSRTFQTIMTAYPISLCTTMLLVFIALLCYRPSKRFAYKEWDRNSDNSLPND